MRSILLILLALLSVGTAAAATRVWLIGGGNTLRNSQGQIEENVRWLQRVLTERGVEFRTYYTSGKTPMVDVVYFAAGEDRDPDLERVLRVFGDETAYANRTKRNTLALVDGTTEKTALLAALKQDFASVGPNDSVLIVYNGHGDMDAGDTSRNSLKLWGDGRLSVSEFGRALNDIDRRATVRVVMTQCFSGAFAALAYEAPKGINSAAQRRCGYFAESDMRESEGCDLGINQSEFRDYTTYLFAALTGSTRLGEQIPSAEVDLDGSGTVSFEEAHHYTLKHGINSDLPRSTSEAFLERSEPWYLRWNSFSRGDVKSRYRDAARHIAQREGLAEHGPRLVHELTRRHRWRTGIEADIASANRSLRQMQIDLRSAVVGREPLASEPNFWLRLAPAATRRISAGIAEQPGYRELVALQEQQLASMASVLTAKRSEAQVERILWLNRIARLERHFAGQVGGAGEQLDRLKECERGAFP
ncbi:MAG: hypothetical protein HZA64_06615 [Rhodocyclales bacterium]|nr:hypothetical protein [Rhodocyclales bacterium]